MNKKFDIFMKSIDDDLLEEAQLYIPRKRGFFKAVGLAACLCIVMGAYYLSFSGFGAKSEAAAPDNLYAEIATTAACAQGEAVTESAVMTTANESSPAPTMASSPSSPLPANAIVCGFSVTEDEKTIDFSVGEMDFTLKALETDDLADQKHRNVLLSDEEKETITWYSEDGDTKYSLELIEGDYDLLYSTAKEIAGNLGIRIKKTDKIVK